MKIGRYYHTLKYLKGKQLFHQVLMRLKPLALEINLKGSFSGKKGYSLKHVPWLPAPKSYDGKNSFRFLNLEGSFTGDWNITSNGRLWNYNLNYMDYLIQPDIATREGLKWISTFIERLHENISGREPYPLSVRCLNWIKFISANRQNIQPEELQEIDSSLYAQLHALSENPEYHLLGNHLMMNGVSLFFGAFYFRDKKIFDQACEILIAESEEQILSDGGHFELSPMYHQQVLSLFLDCLNLLGNNREIFRGQEKLEEILKQKASLMLGWIENMTLPDGEIPLFNDSAMGISPDTKALNEYATKLGVPVARIRLADSGYRRFSGRNYVLIADIGKIGPDYIPGHAHADTFSFVLYMGGKQVVVDTGISTYEKNSARQQERDTSSHNTVVFGAKSSSDVWGGFRAGRRAKVKILKDSDYELAAEHDGYNHYGTTHRRRFFFSEESIKIYDELSSGKSGVLNLHFHPDRKIQLYEDKIILDCCTITYNGLRGCKIEDYNYHPGFNLNVNAKKFEGVFSNSCEMTFSAE